MQRVICVGIGGGIGAIIRYLITKQSAGLFNCNIPLGTLIVNVLGGFLIGMIMELSVSTDFISPNLKLFLTTGIMGGLTTFSTFSYETITLMNDGRYLLGFSNIFLNLFLSLGGVILSTLLCKVIF
ncbi:fluoride efflux transporter CrcB [Clostridium saccharobutylicum]|uniref:Fluoride-specific ion channel FluC n=1 Tax=Clostridium saccharobutylicum DSM 13864 TaxID=1345695 RepID=U5MTZ5_CLOSA|nr:fluoride efflux transporter CrcB [Clostridium saccharobutylicum]AGX44065.1 protein CrcB [Clostridium saccharobutylicum DSM 13864]AQR91356.1 putative fluoride ion transporter CrcB [Clostridium saccharobutylicum]AQS01260.1 putative fluoride ion transporter CrcB [Clostridium saccharobutylicum]AQS15243.1 putative fluoride ion transporter CrcB [Clostridium saccharobutylicum]MBA2905882.1 CrcB protein [Clostridium saccharobutylicum]